MRAGAITLALAIVTTATTAVFEARPFEQPFHGWGFAVATALVGVFLLVQGLAGLRTPEAAERFASLGALGGALVCASAVSAAFAVGHPHLIAGAPGQATPVGSGSTPIVAFPPVLELKDAVAAPDSVSVVAGGRASLLRAGQTTRRGQYVLRVVQGPIARVVATTLAGKRVTITQPQGSAFASPYLLFPAQIGDQRLDYFAVPPLHRTVDVTYFPRYRDESRGIDIETPFVLVQVSEQNGAPLFRGPAVSRKPIHGGGLALTFYLGRYPSVEVTSSPAIFPAALGALMLLAGLSGYVWTLARAQEKAPA